MLIIRKGNHDDLPAIWSLYNEAISKMDKEGIPQWDSQYPTLDIVSEDIKQQTLYIGLLEGQIAVVFVVSSDAEPAYSTAPWKYKGASFNVLHRLCVHPSFQGMGIAQEATLAAEEISRTQGIECLRLDAFSKNPAALHLYEKLHYIKIDAVSFRKGTFFLFEKKL